MQLLAELLGCEIDAALDLQAEIKTTNENPKGKTKEFATGNEDGVRDEPRRATCQGSLRRAAASREERVSTGRVS